MYRKEHAIYRVLYYSRFQASTGGLGKYTMWIKWVTVYFVLL